MIPGLVTIGSPALWAGFLVFVLAMLALDLGVFHRREHAVSIKEALIWTAVWISLALIFNAGVYHWFGSERGLEFLTGYLIEKALSVDNLFVFLVIFSYFGVAPSHQHRVLFWGILGALVMRAIFILAGAALIQSFHWVIYIFGGFLVITAVKLMIHKEGEVHPERNPLFLVFRKLVPSTTEYDGTHFIVRKGGKLFATPLMLVLVTVEGTDLVFATDSIPAIFGVTTDPFIVFTSNIFAILGLRALYFVLAGMMGKFRFLKYGLALVLGFVGVKMLISKAVEIPIPLSLGAVAGILAVSVGISLLIPSAPAGEANQGGGNAEGEAAGGPKHS